MAILVPSDFQEPVVWSGFVGDQSIFALADGTIRFPAGGDRGQEVHDGLLAATRSRDGQSLITGGEDGKVQQIGAEGAVATLAEKPGKWIDAVAAGPDGAVAFLSGRTLWSLHNGSERLFEHERAVEGVDFATKGLRVAVARYNGVSLHWLAGVSNAVDLAWDGAHTSVRFSPDGRYIVTTMAENALHGWRLDDRKSAAGKHMRMTGYPAKPKSLSWSPKGRWLASSGAQAAICWPFFGKDGPMGKAPRELGTRGDSMVVQVCCHPAEEVVAVGYADGMIMAVRIEDAAETLLRRPGKGSISSLNWDDKGFRLAFGSEEGEAGIVNVGDG